MNVLPALALRMLRSTDARLLWKFGYNFGYKGMRSVQRFKRRLKQGQVFPPFLYISIINSCNLRCQGCWVDVSAKQQKIDVPAMVFEPETFYEYERIPNESHWTPAANRAVGPCAWTVCRRPGSPAGRCV